LVDRLLTDRGAAHLRPGHAIDTHRPPAGAIIYSDHGVRFGSWAFTARAQQFGLVPSMVSR
jgi:putative transposase